MLVFIHINKTAGRTVRYILRSSYGPRHCEVEPWHARWSDPPFSSHDLQRLRKLYPHLDSIAGHRITGNVDLQENGTKFDYFTFMRDPIKTCASRFQYNVQYRKKNIEFEDWIQQDWTRDQQTKRIAGGSDVNQAIRVIQQKNIFVGVTERFDESMLLLKALVSDNLNISYERVNVARDNTIAKNLLETEKTRQMLIEANQADLELYNFINQDVFPSFQRDYGSSLEADVFQNQQSRSDSFNNRNIILSRMKQYLLYKPLVYLHRKGIKVV